MPVTKESCHGEAKIPDQTKDQGSTAVEQLPEEKIPEKQDVSETKKKLLLKEDTNVPMEQICSPPSAKLVTEAGDDAGVVEKSEMTDSNIARSEISIPVTNSPTEKRQLKGTIETGYLSPSGERLTSPDLTMSTLSICTQSEQGTELDTLSGRGSSLQCRNCKNMHTSSDEKPTSCLDLCPFCTAATTSPFRPEITQPPENPVKNRNTDLEIEDESQSEDGPADPVVVGSGEQTEMPPNSFSPPADNSPNTNSPSPEVKQSQSNSNQSGGTSSGGTSSGENQREAISQDWLRICSSWRTWCRPLMIGCCLGAGVVILIVIILAVYNFLPLPSSSSQILKAVKLHI